MNKEEEFHYLEDGYYVEKLEQEIERLKEKHFLIQGGRFNSKTYITNLEKEKEDYKSRCEKAIEFCDYLLSHDEVVINDKTYIKQNGDDIITNAIKSKLLGGDEE